MSIILAPYTTEVKSAAPISTWPVIEFHPEPCILATEAASFAAWMAEDAADADQWSDEFADEQAGLALAESQIESGLMAW